MPDSAPTQDTSEQAGPASHPAPVRVKIAARELAPVLASLALQCPDRREELASLDPSRDKAAVYLREHERPADLRFRPIADYHPDLCLIAARALDAEAGAVVCVVFQSRGEELAFAFEAPAREEAAPAPDAHVMPESAGQPPVSAAPPITLSRDELAQILRETVAPLHAEIEALKAERAQARPATREEIYAARAAEYEAAIHESMLAEMKSRKKQDLDEVFEKMWERSERFLERMYQANARVQALAAEHAPPAAEKPTMGEAIVTKVLSKVDEFTSGASKEPFTKKATG